jgi:U3 small nucleolar RNA-associated protein 22
MNFDKHRALENALHNLKAIFDAIPNGKPMKVLDDLL